MADVAPCAGAWIETLLDGTVRLIHSSPPVRGRGLKQSGGGGPGAGLHVAPCAGAWIETLYLF